MKLKGIQTNCCTKQERECIQTASLVYHAGYLNTWYVELSPGVTGYESASVDSLLKENRFLTWPACAGTDGSWDRLVIPAAEMERLKDYLRLLQPVLALVPVRQVPEVQLASSPAPGSNTSQSQS